MTEVEEWAHIAGYEGLYEVSTFGNVRSWSRTKRGALLKPRSNKQGYLSVALTRAGSVKHRKIHQLVLEAFVGPRPEGTVCRHLDGNPVRNVVGNLAWGTQSENMADAIRHGTHSEARKTHCSSGHEYTEANTVVRKNGKRRCRACQRIRNGYKGGLPMRERTHCPSGHEYTPENTVKRGPTGARRCRVCERARRRARYLRDKASRGQ
ncbi:NUMOD4 motif-containing HNH endonuclease [Streptomyces tendae]